MKKALAAAAAVAAMFAGAAAFAQADNEIREGRAPMFGPARPTPAMDRAAAAAPADKRTVSSAIVTPLKNAQKALADKDYAGALETLKVAQALPGLSDYDNYVLNQFVVQADLGLKDYPGADVALEAAVDSGQATDAEKPPLLATVVQLSAIANHCGKALAYAPQAAALEPLNEDANTNLAICAYTLKRMPDALNYAHAALDQAKAAGHPPKLAVLEIAMTGQIQAGNQAGALRILEQIAAVYGTPERWGKLLGVSIVAGSSDIDLLDLYRLRDVAGAMASEDDSANMAALALHLGYPVEARAILQKAATAGKLTSPKSKALLAQASAAADRDEKGAAAFAALAEQQRAGEFDAKLADTWYGYARYADAAAAARRAIAKGGLKDPGQANFVLAQSLARQDKFADALSAMANVAGGSPGRAKAARLWTLYLQGKASAASPAPTTTAAAAP